MAIRSRARNSPNKLAWMDRLAAHAAELFAADVPVVLAGDYNVVPTDRDIYPTKSYAKDALLQPESRARFARLLEQGWRRCDPHAASRCADVHILGLHAKPLAARCRTAHRSSAAQRAGREAAGRRRRRSRGSRQGRCQRSCPGLGRAARRAGPCRGMRPLCGDESSADARQADGTTVRERRPAINAATKRGPSAGRCW